MFRLLSKQVLKPMGVCHHPPQLYYLTRSISTTPTESVIYNKLCCLMEGQERLRNEMETRFDRIESLQERLGNEMETKFQRVDEKFERVECRIVTLQEKLGY
ncbi:hypothetical protein L873DRAFT_1824571 [Choiromyces venosus 120613-1]|uniref:Uncharacterized protein n=1 Tax=Choiromyces venosus 120613-1 TaxID=1336337 RepID=A0A3N4IVV9_9PEZI|nr:hypothetical protein L873DRAFT_1824571 [Choiromyces venosus 120613-1]